ncbi:hypothetical protein VKT23_019316 [Stygiomarasmius scandens]|uniref:Uncharacterized protein n=1 Tax=Marasmiellus scandens TaxID=2682957 RepID=A0ABR1IR55_9AGAR
MKMTFSEGFTMKKKYDGMAMGGLLLGHIPLRIARLIYLGPSSATGEKSKSTKPGNAKIHGMTYLTPEAIAYIVVHTRISMSDIDTYSKIEGEEDPEDPEHKTTFDYCELWRIVVKLLEQEYSKHIIDEWNRVVFDIKPHVSKPKSRPRSGPSAFEQIEMQHAAMKAPIQCRSQPQQPVSTPQPTLNKPATSHDIRQSRPQRSVAKDNNNNDNEDKASVKVPGRTRNQTPLHNSNDCHETPPPRPSNDHPEVRGCTRNQTPPHNSNDHREVCGRTQNQTPVQNAPRNSNDHPNTSSSRPRPPESNSRRTNTKRFQPLVPKPLSDKQLPSTNSMGQDTAKPVPKPKKTAAQKQPTRAHPTSGRTYSTRSRSLRGENNALVALPLDAPVKKKKKQVPPALGLQSPPSLPFRQVSLARTQTVSPERYPHQDEVPESEDDKDDEDKQARNKQGSHKRRWSGDEYERGDEYDNPPCGKPYFETR